MSFFRHLPILAYKGYNKSGFGMNSIQGEIIPIDGKTLRGSYDRNKGQSARIFSKSQGSLAAKT